MAAQLMAGKSMEAIPLEAVSDHGDPIVQVLNDIQAGVVGLVAGADKIEQIALASGLGWEMTLDPRTVGIDIVNRGGEGVSTLECALLAEYIVADGWSWAMVKHACCIEERPGARVIQEFNEKLVAGTDLAPVKDEIRYGSLSCGHTNQILRAMQAGMPSKIALVTENGKYDMARIRSRDMELYKAVTTGLTWKVLSWRTRVWYPTVPDILTGARNMAASTLRKQGEMEGLLRLHRNAVGSGGLDASGAPAWHEAKASVLKTRPPFAEKIDTMIGFVATK